MKYYFTPDRSVIIISAICIIILGYMIYYIFNARIWYSAIPTSLAVLLFIFFACKTPYCIIVEEDNIKVKQLIGSMRITDIQSIEPIVESDLKETIRTFGNGGFLGYTGRYYSPKLGRFKMAAINTKELAKITTMNGNIYIINFPKKLFNNKC